MCAALRGFPGVELSVMKQGETQASWEELVTLHLQEKVTYSWEGLSSAFILSSPAAVNLKAEVSQYV